MMVIMVTMVVMKTQEVEYLLVELNDNLVFRWTLVGVTSFGVDCARPDFPGKYISYSLQF